MRTSWGHVARECKFDRSIGTVADTAETDNKTKMAIDITLLQSYGTTVLTMAKVDDLDSFCKCVRAQVRSCSRSNTPESSISSINPFCPSRESSVVDFQNEKMTQTYLELLHVMTFLNALCSLAFCFLGRFAVASYS